MGVLNEALDIITARFCELLDDDVQVEDHPGRFTEDELGNILLRPKSVLVAIEQLPSIEVDGDGMRKATVRFVAFVLCADTHGSDRHRAALDLVERCTEILPFNRWEDREIFEAVVPDTIAAENLYSGEVNNGQGLAWWAISWTQSIHRRR